MPCLNGAPLWLGLLVLSVAASTTTGCGSESARPNEEPPSEGGAANAGQPTALEFDALTLTMAPGESRSVVVRATPAGKFRVRFALLGDVRDASLDRTEVVSDSDGNATVQLSAPTEPLDTVFQLRASVGTVSTQADVKVSTTGSASLTITPLYDGARPVSAWVAGAWPNTTCASLSAPAPDADHAATADAGETPIVSVPAGRPLAVTVRSASNVSGCLDVPALAVDEEATVEVPVVDVPLTLAGVTLAVSLDLADPDPTWSELLAPVLERLDAALLDDAQDDIDALLDAMTRARQESAGSDDVETARATGGWDGALVSELGDAASSTAIRARVHAWYEAGAARLDQSALLGAELVPLDGIPDRAHLVALTLAGMPGAAMGLPEEVLVTWKAEPGDRVALGAQFGWLPWLTYTECARGEARAETTKSTLEAALAASLDCAALAAELHGRALSALPDCDVTCLAEVCTMAVTDLWQRGSRAVAADLAWLNLSATALATVDDDAHPTGFSGQWVGTLGTVTQEAQAKGSASGSLPALPSE